MGRHAIAHRAPADCLAAPRSGGILAGGAGASIPRKRVSTYTPRTVGDVRVAVESAVNGPA